MASQGVRHRDVPSSTSNPSTANLPMLAMPRWVVNSIPAIAGGGGQGGHGHQHPDAAVQFADALAAQAQVAQQHVAGNVHGIALQGGDHDQVEGPPP